MALFLSTSRACFETRLALASLFTRFTRQHFRNTIFHRLQTSSLDTIPWPAVSGHHRTAHFGCRLDCCTYYLKWSACLFAGWYKRNLGFQSSGDHYTCFSPFEDFLRAEFSVCFLQAIDALTSNYDLTMRPASTVGWISASFFISYPPVRFYISLPRSWRLMSWLISIVNRGSDFNSDASFLGSINCVFCSPFEFNWWGFTRSEQRHTSKKSDSSPSSHDWQVTILCHRTLCCKHPLY